MPTLSSCSGWRRVAAMGFHPTQRRLGLGATAGHLEELTRRVIKGAQQPSGEGRCMEAAGSWRRQHVRRHGRAHTRAHTSYVAPGAIPTPTASCQPFLRNTQLTRRCSEGARCRRGCLELDAHPEWELAESHAHAHTLLLLLGGHHCACVEHPSESAPCSRQPERERGEGEAPAAYARARPEGCAQVRAPFTARRAPCCRVD